jgi:hypothetical protein
MTTDTSVPGQKTITLGIPAGVPGDMGGPNGGVLDGDYVVFDGPSGKLVKKASGAPGGQNDALFALEIADLKGDRLGMSGGVADAFDDETGVLTKTNAIYDAANDLYSPSATPATITLNAPSLTGGSVNVTYIDRSHAIPNGRTVNAIGVYSTTAGSFTLKILRQNSATNFDVVQSFVVNHSGAGWQDFNFSTPYVIPASGTYNLASLTPLSNANNTASSVARSYILSDASGSGVAATADTGIVHPLRYVYPSGAYQSMTLTSVSYTATAQPSSGRLALQVQGSETFAINADLIGELSRDNGITWAAASLTLTSSVSGIRMFEAAAINLTSQPAGTAMKWRVRTGNSKNIRVSGVVAQWKD